MTSKRPGAVNVQLFLQESCALAVAVFIFFVFLAFFRQTTCSLRTTTVHCTVVVHRPSLTWLFYLGGVGRVFTLYPNEVCRCWLCVCVCVLVHFVLFVEYSR